jgi:hypothetical protein
MLKPSSGFSLLRRKEPELGEKNFQKPLASQVISRKYFFRNLFWKKSFFTALDSLSAVAKPSALKNDKAPFLILFLR